MLSILQYLGSSFLGWSLGANDSANVFGTAVSSRMVRYRLAIILTAIFVCVGAIVQGGNGIRTLSEDLRRKTAGVGELMTPALERRAEADFMRGAVIASFAAALTVTLMTILKIPVSTSQAVVGAIIGLGIMERDVNFSGLGKVVACWLGTPVGAAVLTLLFYWIFAAVFRRWRPSVFSYDPLMSLLLIICGCYGAYALGANNVANVSAVFVREGGMTVEQAAAFGAIVIAAGSLTYSKPVMMTVGRGVVRLNSFTAFICVLSHAVTVHIYAIIGVPVSTSQAIIGAILGIGIIKGGQTINYRMLRKIALGWISTPILATLLAIIGFLLSNLRYHAAA